MEREGLLGDIKDNQSTSTSRNRCYIHVITVLLLLFFIGIRNHNWKPSTTDLTKVAALPPESLFNTTTDENEDPLFAYNSFDCPYEEWNQVTTTIIPNTEVHENWMRSWKPEKQPFLYHTKPSAMSAFAQKDQIVVALTSASLINSTMYCRYYDCRRREISDPFQNVIFHKSTVFCALRPNAKYIAVSATSDETPEYSVPIVPRINKPPHYFTVCMAPLYGDEPKFLQIVDFIEYHKLQGATFFHIYLRNVTDYDRMMLDEYVKTGDIEIIKMHDHFWRADYMWHDVQINDCHHRSKYFSKWTALIDIDERLEIRNEQFKTVVDYLDSIHNASIANLRFRVKWVIKDNNTPERYENDKQITDEMLFHKYQNTSQLGNFFDQPKCIIRPENVAIMTIHGPLTMYKGERITSVDKDIGFIRHYRSVEQRVFPGALERMMKHAPFNILPVEQWIEKNLTENILSRVKLVYDIVDVTCEEKMKMYSIENVTAPCSIGKQDLFTKL
ncbi:Glycosyltransferase family 92 protein [Caenorhabditis elegans]|uniref:Glycosyltransferase family 92 protein n=1 Tax=Caenorhabditis elegans TaxID=6239 RepID=O17105_CAEEL|nr:Glycosyltransferase family 92 protein [Caenorhabditis elegans]CCD64477.2 Glycosyltransferase family 92 protein [Caenorhabditis elegans]|eukprot:NP_503251.3 Uncharacterized protein CELE_K06H6.4 [Caenorhabditis elegans]